MSETRYVVEFVPGLKVYGIVDTRTGLFENYLYYDDAATAQDEADFMNDPEGGDE